MVTGLGMIGGKVLRTLQERGVEVIPVNRTVPGTDKPAGVLAHDIGGLQGLLIDADVVVLATSSQEPVLTRSIMVDIMDNRGQRPLVIVDAGMPRNADPSVQEISGITLINLEAVAARTEGVLESRSRAAADVERIISEEADAFDRWRKNQESREIITALRRKADRIRRTEIRRAIERMPGLTQAAVEVLEQASSAIVTKLLHEPTLRLRNSGEGVRERARVVRDLFDLSLDDPASESIQ